MLHPNIDGHAQRLSASTRSCTVFFRSPNLSATFGFITTFTPPGMLNSVMLVPRCTMGQWPVTPPPVPSPVCVGLSRSTSTWLAGRPIADLGLGALSGADDAHLDAVIGVGDRSLGGRDRARALGHLALFEAGHVAAFWGLLAQATESEGREQEGPRGAHGGSMPRVGPAGHARGVFNQPDPGCPGLPRATKCSVAMKVSR